MTSADEEWRPIEGWPEYEVSNLGRIRSLRARKSGTRPPRVLKPWALLGGKYRAVTLYWDGGNKKFSVHQLVCAAFHGPAPSAKHEVAHWDGDGANNVATNLRWATCIENNADKIRHGRKLRGEQVPYSKIAEADVLEIRNLAAKGVDDEEIAEKYGISIPYVAQIRLGKCWEWLIGDKEKIKKSPYRGVGHHKTKLTPEQIFEIRLAPESVKQSVLAEKYGVQQGTISQIRTRRSWKHIE